MCVLCIGSREGEAVVWRSVIFRRGILKPAMWMRPREKEALFGVDDPGVRVFNDALQPLEAEDPRAIARLYELNDYDIRLWEWAHHAIR